MPKAELTGTFLSPPTPIRGQVGRNPVLLTPKLTWKPNMPSTQCFAFMCWLELGLNKNFRLSCRKFSLA